MSKAVIQASWDDVPHLTEQAKNELLASIPPYQRDARTKGIPQLGAGAIYPVSESDVLIPDFELPPYFPRAYAMDVGWNRTAALWGARDNETGIVYLYSEYYKGQAEPVIHTQGIKARGEWIPGVIDPASRGRSQFDGEKLIETYRQLGLVLTPSKNAVEAGIYEVWQMLSNGRLKVFKSLQNWLMEFRIYQRDEKGYVVKQNDHLMDCMRYLVLSGLNVMMVKQSGQQAPPRKPTGWMSV
jgi:Terminase RNaseH-like domain